MMTPIILVVLGLFFLLDVVIINLVLQPLWFPNEIDRAAGPPANAAQTAIPHLALSIIVAILALVGVTLLALGCVELGIMFSRG